ncbi:MAG: GGDEF domain-containing protein [Selenomonadaceae bacterium]|nr:GGDEF domain-containing protein [Selenomonadaceae bacterium]
MTGSNFEIPAEFDTEIYRTLNDVENIIYFTWEIGTDKLEFVTPVENSDYALPQSAMPASTVFFGGNVVHPDDGEKFAKFFDEMFWLQKTTNDSKFFSNKIRLLGKEDRGYLWAELRLLLYFDDNGPVRGFGCICNINVKQLWQLELQHSAEHDVLTGFFNKIATQRHIEEYLSQLSPDDLPPALLIIDADGFKAINDSFGHLFGDGVLADMGLAIRGVFRQKDIVGRIGGDEFIVLFTEMPSLDVLERRCNELLKNLDRHYENNGTSLPFSVSIGIALYPEHGTTYTELFTRADRALYDSKSHGKNQYSVYRSSLIGRSFSVDSARDPQHAEDIRQKAFEDNMLEFILNMLYETQNHEMTISVCIGMLGKQFNLDRVSVARYNQSSNRYVNEFEWLSPNGISITSGENVQKYADLLERRYQIIDANYRPTPYGVMSICEDTIKKFPQDIEVFETLRLGSFVHSMIAHGSEIVGSVGFETSNLEHEFSKEEYTRLSIFSVLLGNVLLSRQQDSVSEKISKHLQNILDHMQEFIYVVDKETFEPIYFNNTIRQTLISTAVEQTCYRRFHNLDAPCEGCPIAKLSKNGNEYIDVRINNWGVETPARAYNIRWDDDMDKYLALIIQSSF